MKKVHKDILDTIYYQLKHLMQGVGNVLISDRQQGHFGFIDDYIYIIVDRFEFIRLMQSGLLYF